MVSILRPARKKAKRQQEQEVVKGLLPTVEPTIKSGYVNEPIPETAEVVEKYWIKEPFSGVVIAKLPESGGSLEYFVQEITLTEQEQMILDKIIEIVSVEINPASLEKQEDIKVALLEEAKRIMKKYVKKFPRLLDQHVREKINYYLERDLLGYGPIHTLMNDWRIEDISCDGVNSNIYIWHRRYESVPTSIKFTDRKALDDFIVKLAHKSGKHVSSAFPIVDAMIFGKHRLAASFREEISPKGSTFTIRKFREEPYSIIDLMNLNTVSDSIAAYLWLMMENRASILVIGGTAAGKTTILNAIAGLIKPGYKVVTVEETAEINVPTENWVQFTSRESYGLTGNKVGEVSLFDLVRTSLRYRPDFLIVGEVRGEEAFVLFQAVASVTGDTPVLIREKNKTKLVRIEELVDRFYDENEERIAKFVEGIEVLSVDKEKRVTFMPISYVLRHKTNEIYTISYPGGSVRATGNHSVFIIDDDGSIKEKPVSSLSTNDYLVSFSRAQIKRQSNTSEISQFTKPVSKELILAVDSAGKVQFSYSEPSTNNHLTNNFFAPLPSQSNSKSRSYGAYRSTISELIDSSSWQEMLGGKAFSGKKRKGRIASLLFKHLKSNQDELVPIKPLKRITQLLIPAKIPSQFEYLLNNQQGLITKKAARKILNWIFKDRIAELTDEAYKIVENFEELVESTLVASRIDSITKQKFNGFVYDISVPGSEAFFGGKSPILLHNTGHGGLCTIHGESLDTAVKRLTSPPMNVAESYIPLMNVALMLERVVLPKTVAGVPFGRRVTNVWEIEDFAKYVSVFEWSPTEDIFYDYTRRSVMLHRFAYRSGRSFTDMLEEIERRKALLKYLQVNNIRQVKEVYKYITEYYVDREALFRRLGIKVETESAQPPSEAPADVQMQPAEPEVQQASLPLQPDPEISKMTSLPTEPIKILQSGSFQILNALFEAKSPIEEEVLMKSVGLDRAEFDSLISMLVKVGHANVEKKGDGPDQKSYISITQEGMRAYSLISKNVGQEAGKKGGRSQRKA